MDIYVQIRKSMIDDIPVLICNSSDKNKKESIIILHKLMEEKEHKIL